MLTPITLPNQPTLAADFDLGAGRYCRITVTKTGSASGHIHYEAQGWQCDANGVFVIDPVSGWPVRTPGSVHGIVLSGLAAKTCRRDPGWMIHVPPSGTTLDPQAPPEGWATGNGAPTVAASEGDRYLDLQTAQGWEWTSGELERIRRGKAEELLQILVERELELALEG